MLLEKRPGIEMQEDCGGGGLSCVIRSFRREQNFDVCALDPQFGLPHAPSDTEFGGFRPDAVFRRWSLKAMTSSLVDGGDDAGISLPSGTRAGELTEVSISSSQNGTKFTNCQDIAVLIITIK